MYSELGASVSQDVVISTSFLLADLPGAQRILKCFSTRRRTSWSHLRNPVRYQNSYHVQINLLSIIATHCTIDFYSIYPCIIPDTRLEHEEGNISTVSNNNFNTNLAKRCSEGPVTLKGNQKSNFHRLKARYLKMHYLHHLWDHLRYREKTISLTQRFKTR